MKNTLFVAVLLISSLMLSQCQTQSSAYSAIGKSGMQAYSAVRNKGQNTMSLQTVDKVSGEYMKAFLVAYDAFKEDAEIPDEKKRMENYNIEFSQEGKYYSVFFYAKRKPSERDLKGGQSELGRDVTYTISKENYKLLARVFHK